MHEDEGACKEAQSAGLWEMQARVNGVVREILICIDGGRKCVRCHFVAQPRNSHHNRTNFRGGSGRTRLGLFLP